jgi:hypothetical protein
VEDISIKVVRELLVHANLYALQTLWRLLNRVLEPDAFNNFDEKAERDQRRGAL